MKKEWAIWVSIFIIGVVIGALITYTVMPGKIIEVGGPPKPEVPTTPVKIAYVAHQTGVFTVLGDPMTKAAILTVEEINRAGGILGRQIELKIVDEAMGVDALTAEIKRLYEVENVDVVIGLIASSSELAITKVAEDYGRLLIIDNAGSARLFDTTPYKYTFRTSVLDWWLAVADGLAILELCPNITKYAVICQDYSWGRDTAKYSFETIKKFKPDVTMVYEGYPALGAADFTSFIAAAMAAKPDVIYSSMWGGDLVKFVTQGKALGLFESGIRVFLCVADNAYIPMGKDFPENVLVGSFGMGGGAGFPYPPKYSNPLLYSFIDKYVEKFGTYPMSSCLGTRDAFYFYKYAVEKASALRGGGWPTIDEIIKAGEGLAFQSPCGYIQIREDHIYACKALYGRTIHVPDSPIVNIVDVVVIPPERYIPPQGVKFSDFLRSLGS